MNTFFLGIAAFVVGIYGLLYLKRGPIFLPTKRRAVFDMIRMLDVKPGNRAVDLGSGDGRIVIALARAGRKPMAMSMISFLRGGRGEKSVRQDCPAASSYTGQIFGKLTCRSFRLLRCSVLSTS